MSKSKKSNIEYLLETVINNGYCIGCGTCAVVKDSGIHMTIDEFGFYKAILPELDHNNNVVVTNVCPFSDDAVNENEISRELFEKDCHFHPEIGYYSALYAGYVAEGSFREEGSSGGIVSWLLCELLENDLIDGILQVKSRQPSVEDPRLFQYQISRNYQEVRLSSKSRYYPVEMSEVLKLILEQPGRYVVVGLPCFIKAIRLLISKNEVIKKRIHYCLALVCGHLKSQQYAQMLAWQCGIKPENLLDIDFRKKMPLLKANQYSCKVTGLVEGEILTKTILARELFGSDWGLCFFKYKACDYCDDLFGETADVTVGDAWIMPYMKDSFGNNIIIIRNLLIKRLIEENVGSGRLMVEKVECDDVIKSQKSGLFHRKEALAYRLFLTDKTGQWRPPKRVIPREHHLNIRLQRKHQIRMTLAEYSTISFKKAKEKDQLDTFIDTMYPIVHKYRSVEKPFWKLVIKKIILLIPFVRNR